MEKARHLSVCLDGMQLPSKKVLTIGVCDNADEKHGWAPPKEPTTTTPTTLCAPDCYDMSLRREAGVVDVIVFVVDIVVALYLKIIASKNNIQHGDQTSYAGMEWQKLDAQSMLGCVNV